MRTRAWGLALLLCGCSPSVPPLPSDAGTIADAPGDGGTRPPRTDGGTTVYTRCASATDCAPGFLCDLQFPGGQCTLPCVSDAECPEDGRCLGGGCFRRCRAGGGAWCRDDQLCMGTSAVCVASCSVRPELPALRCASGLACLDNYCSRLLGGPGALGAPCASAEECSTRRCLGLSASFPEGMCARLVRMVSIEAWLAPGPMPVGRCPDGSVVGLGPGDTATEGDDAYCLPRCVSDDECRDGYYCERHGTAGAPLHDDGFCTPWLCPAFGIIPDCPAPNVCVRDAAGLSACRRPPPAP